MTDDEHIIISAEQSEVLTRPVVGILANILPGVLLISLVILFMSCLYREIDDWLHDESDNLMKRIFTKDMGAVKEQDLALDMELNRMSRRLLILLFVALIVLHFLSVCDVEYWVPVRTRSFEVACKILVENGIKPTGGYLLNT